MTATAVVGVAQLGEQLQHEEEGRRKRSCTSCNGHRRELRHLGSQHHSITAMMVIARTIARVLSQA